MFKPKVDTTRSDILQGQALFRGVKQLRRCLGMLNNFEKFKRQRDRQTKKKKKTKKIKTKKGKKIKEKKTEEKSQKEKKDKREEDRRK